MSASEGKQNDRMSAKDIEAEEMAQELMNMEMFEEGMGYEQMKEILQVINESKDMAGIKPDNRSSPEIMECLPNITISKVPSKSNLTREETTVPKLSYSYRQQSGRASPSASGRKSALEEAVDEEMSAPSPELFTIEEPKRSSTERESIVDQLMKQNDLAETEEPARASGKSDWPSLPGSSPNSQHSESNLGPDKWGKNKRAERWRLDPTDPVVQENDVPLKQGRRPLLSERVPYSFCHNKRALEEPRVRQKVLEVLAYALEEAADIWRRKHRPDVSEFQWGLPIKVGSNIRNSDKKNITEDADSPQRAEITRRNPDSAQRRNMDRNCKRKAVEYVKNLVHNKIESDDTDEDIFERTKKPKTIDKPWEPLTRANVTIREKNLTRQEKMFNNTSSLKAEDPLVIGEYDSDDFDNDNLSSLRLRQNKKVKENSRPSSPEFIPRRIVPPNPSKPRAAHKPQRKNGEKAKRKSPVRKNAQATLETNQNTELSVSKGRGKNSAAKQKMTLHDDEITSELEIDAGEEDEVEIEIKPKPVKGLAGKLQFGASKLIEIKNAEERLEKSKKEEQLRADQNEQMRRKQVQMDRYLKEQEEKEEREAKEAQLKAKEESYRRNEVIRERERWRKQTLEKKSILLVMDDDDDVPEGIIHRIDAEQRNNEDRVQCPICNLEFSRQEVQNHAAECEQYDNVVRPGPSRSPTDNDVSITNENRVYECYLCSMFTTTDPVIYEEHVNVCKKREINGLGSPSREVIEVPTSPIRCFVPISEQTESSINYAEQFPNRTVKPSIVQQRRKRKR